MSGLDIFLLFFGICGWGEVIILYFTHKNEMEKSIKEWSARCHKINNDWYKYCQKLLKDLAPKKEETSNAEE